MNKKEDFNTGTWVKATGTLFSNWSKQMSVLKDGVPRKILEIFDDNVNSNVIRLMIDGIENSSDRGYWCFYLESLEIVKDPFSLPTLKEWLELHNLPGATDKDGCSFAFLDVPVKSKYYDSWVSLKLDSEKSCLEITDLIQRPTCDWKDSLFIPTSMQPKYDTYDFHEDFEMCWIGEEVVIHENICIISGIKQNKLILSDKDVYEIYHSLSDSFIKTSFEMLNEGWLWNENQKPFGKEIKNEK